MRCAPAWIGRNGLEWSWRLFREPGRMGRRYLANTRIFTLLLADVPGAASPHSHREPARNPGVRPCLPGQAASSSLSEAMSMT